MSAAFDLRSDTVTKPTPAMRKAMASAEVGDDVFGEDATVNRLEAMAAERVGKEAGLFVPSGTMANLIAVMTHTHPGEEVLLGSESHIFHYEAGGAARVANTMVHPLRNDEDGSIDPGTIAANVRRGDIHAARTTLLCIENTQNRCGGRALDAAKTGAMADAAHSQEIAVHLDGARLFNAAVALNVDAMQLAAQCDSVTFCLSKGLGAPVGSVLCGAREFIDEGRRARKMLGGGMRQAGILAAAGVYALEHHIERLGDDHASAREIAEGLRKHAAFAVAAPQTNIVLVDIVTGTLDGWLRALRHAGVLATPFGSRRFRLVTHLGINSDDVNGVIARIDRAVEAAKV